MEFLTNCLNIVLRYYPSFILGIKTTLLIAFTGTIIGLILGLLVGGIKAIKLDKTAGTFSIIIKKV